MISLFSASRTVWKEIALLLLKKCNSPLSHSALPVQPLRLCAKMETRVVKRDDKSIFCVSYCVGEIELSLCKGIVFQIVTSLFFHAEDAEVTSLLFCAKTKTTCFQKKLSPCIPSLDGVRGNTVITHSRLGFLRRDKSVFFNIPRSVGEIGSSLCKDYRLSGSEIPIFSHRERGGDKSVFLCLVRYVGEIALSLGKGVSFFR